MEKIIQTFWLPNKLDNSLLNTGGFVCPEINLMSWAFSCLQLCKFYPEVELHTNQAGKEILIDLLGLPYTKVHLSLETEFIDNLLPSMWAYSKIHTYSIQKEPFLHVDGDIFIWEPFNDKLVQSPLIAQNIEENLSVYKHCLKIIKKKLPFMPNWLEFDDLQIRAYNAGIIGGNDISFFKKYTSLAFEFYERNKKQLASLIETNLETNKHIHIIPEQYLFYKLSNKMNIQVMLQDEKKVDSEIGSFSQFVEIEKIPNEKKYMHVLGNYKRSKQHNDFVGFILKKEYPEYWEKIISIYKEKGILSDYMKRQIQMQKKSQKTVLPQIVNTADEYKYTKFLCKLYNIEMDSDEFLANCKLQDIANLERQLANFNMKSFLKSEIEVTPFNSYNKGINLFDQEGFEDNYIFVSPYHEIATTKFNWSKNLIATKKEEIENISPYKTSVLFYLDMHYFSNNYVWLDDSLVHLLEKIKSKPTKIKELLQLDNLQNNSQENVLLILKQWHAYGIIYLSKSDFITQEPSKAYIENQFNINTQISSCFEYIFDCYKTQKKDPEIIFQFEKPNKAITLQEIITVLKSHNFEALGVRGNLDNLNNVTVPAIAIVKLRGYLNLHVIITEITETHVTIYNTELKELEEYHKNHFSDIWDGILILLSPKEVLA
ncbi:DUF6734 family protein [Flavobacterium taihuense]|uniref:Peptidase C39 domain-containing protein n=1 Tax=Flavobacterium taihuense TaxID=2857508 RepID=A0ABS6XX29_9FLAO|nr:DUF6734 family protein [Flavobacterium taihuense]MBW4361238.1 hypothetical protein [Flavobacterium taihuense]